MNREERNDVARFMLRIKHETPTSQVLIEHDIGSFATSATTCTCSTSAR